MRMMMTSSIVDGPKSHEHDEKFVCRVRQRECHNDKLQNKFRLQKLLVWTNPSTEFAFNVLCLCVL
jgi:hypothetical protein